MGCFVISLLQADERRQHIVNEFGRHQVTFEFFDAITPAQNEAVAKKLGINIGNTVLGPGEAACLLSHLTLWQQAVTQNLPYITIFEDDVFLGANAAAFLNHYEWVPQDCDVIKLEGFSTQIISSIFPTHHLPEQRKLYRLKHKHMGAAGYVLSQHAVRALLVYARNHLPLRPVDHILFDDYILTKGLPVLQMVPALCVQDYILHHENNQLNALPSYLEQDRMTVRRVFPKFKLGEGKDVSKTNLSVSEKLWREAMRPIHQFLHLPKSIEMKLSLKKVEFQ